MVTRVIVGTLASKCGSYHCGGLSILLIAAGGLCAQSADDITAKSIADKSIAAMGGASQFASVESIRMQGRMRFGQGGAFAPFSVIARRPNLFRMELTVGPDHVTQAYDGAIGWQSVSGAHQQEPTALVGDSLAHLIDQAANVIGGPLLDLDKRHNRVELMDRQTVNGADCYRLKIALSTGNTRIIFIDPTSFHEIQEEFPAPLNGRASTVQMSVGDYRKFGPILVACLFVTREKGGEDSQRMEVDSVEIQSYIGRCVVQAAGERSDGVSLGFTRTGGES